MVSAALRAILTELECPADQITTTELCVVEAINNVIEHAYREQGGHSVALRISAARGLLELAVSDRGAAMPEGTLERARRFLQDQQRAPDAALEVADLAEGGYGLSLILQVMDEVSYQRLGDENRLTMSMRVPAPSSEAVDPPRAALEPAGPRPTR